MFNENLLGNIKAIKLLIFKNSNYEIKKIIVNTLANLSKKKTTQKCMYLHILVEIASVLSYS